MEDDKVGEQNSGAEQQPNQEEQGQQSTDVANNTQEDKIVLYQFETCPFCQKVRDKIAELGMDDQVEKVNVERDREDPQRKDIAEKSGVSTVPVMHIDGKWIGDSGAIIDYLENRGSA